MNSKPSATDRLEQVIDHSLRALPLQAAPAELQRRVWARLQRRERWRQRSFASWPLRVRVALLLSCVGCASACVAIWQSVNATQAEHVLARTISQPLHWVQASLAMMNALQQFGMLLIQHAPLSWWHVAAMSLGFMYVLLVGCSAAAFRALYVSH